MKTSNRTISKIVSLRGAAILGLALAGIVTAATHRVPHAQPCHRGESVNRRTGLCYVLNNDCIGGRSNNCPG